MGLHHKYKLKQLKNALCSFEKYNNIVQSIDIVKFLKDYSVEGTEYFRMIKYYEEKVEKGSSKVDRKMLEFLNLLSYCSLEEASHAFPELSIKDDRYAWERDPNYTMITNLFASVSEKDYFINHILKSEEKKIDLEHYKVNNKFHHDMPFTINKDHKFFPMINELFSHRPDHHHDLNEYDFFKGAMTVGICSYVMYNEKLPLLELADLFNDIFADYYRNFAKAKDKYKEIPVQHFIKIINNKGIYCNKYELYLFLIGIIQKVKEYFLIDSEDMREIRKKTVPPPLQREFHVWQDWSQKLNLRQMIERNREEIQKGSNRYNVDEFLKIIPEADKIFKGLFQNEIAKFRRVLNRELDRGSLHRRVSNTSASFYFQHDQLDAFIENLFMYDSDLGYMKYRPKDKQWIKIEGNFDFCKWNCIPQKGFKSRCIYYSNSQVGAFVNRINRMFDEVFKGHPCLGHYDQDKAVRDMLESLQGEDKWTSINLDVAKYSDTLPLALFEKILKLIIDDKELIKAILEVLNLPVFFNNEMREYISTAQGLYFDFNMITLCNIYHQCCVEAKIRKRVIFRNACGDDGCYIIEGEDDCDLEGISTFFWRCLNCIVNDKSEKGNSKTGIISYLKCTYLIEDGIQYNMSGLPPGLVFSRKDSYNQMIALCRFVNKSRYMDIVEQKYDFYNLLDYLTYYFRDPIRDNMTAQEYDGEVIEAIYREARDLLFLRRYILGGEYEWDFTTKAGRDDVIAYFEENKLKWQLITEEARSKIPLIEALCKEANIDITKTVIWEDIEEFRNYGPDRVMEIYDNWEEFVYNMNQEDPIKLTRYVNRIRRLLANMISRRFDYTKGGNAGHHRKEKRKFEDDFLLSKINISLTKKMITLLKNIPSGTKTPESFAMSQMVISNLPMNFKIGLDSKHSEAGLIIEAKLGGKDVLWSLNKFKKTDGWLGFEEGLKHITQNSTDFNRSIVNSLLDNFPKGSEKNKIQEDLLNYPEVLVKLVLDVNDCIVARQQVIARDISERTRRFMFLSERDPKAFAKAFYTDDLVHNMRIDELRHNIKHMTKKAIDDFLASIMIKPLVQRYLWKNYHEEKEESTYDKMLEKSTSFTKNNHGDGPLPF
jgi:hypothetical protein